ncbi:MAG: hypothetical protein ACJATQ_000464 [Cellvibrionaceae bacterium]|jgi:hypothetical protein
MMNLRRMLLIVGAAITVALGGHALAQNVNFYKYVNAKGVNVISSRIPSEYVKKGYEIISSSGRVIQTIPPELSAEEKVRVTAETERLEKLKERDTILLRRYSRPDDIEASKQRKISQVQNRVGLIDLNIEKINAQIDLYQSLAAEDERAGKNVSIDTIWTMEKLKSDRDMEIKERKQKIKEIDRIIDEHDRDIVRLKEIIRLNQQ